MKRTEVLIVAGVTLACAACSDPLGPTSDDGFDTTVPIVASEAGMAQLARNTLSHGATRPETFDVSFWAVKGRSTHVTIGYNEGEYNGHPFLTFEMPAYALHRRPDRSRISRGDSVLITLSIDSNNVLVHLEPTGLRFKWWRPPRLRVWYDHADPDYDNNGVVDEDDAKLESTMLRVWYQESSGTPWHGWSAQHSLSGKWFQAYLRHFSNYAVSW
jgi:hypothetical protein